MPNITAPSDLINSFQNVAGGWLANGANIGRAIFATLAGIDLMWFAFKMFKQRHDFDTAMRAFLFKGIAVGFFASLMFTAPEWIQAVLDTFINYGKQMSGIGSITPSQILAHGMNICGGMLGSAGGTGLFQIGIAFGFYIGAFFVFIGFVAITCQFVIALIESYLSVGMASFWLAFGGSEWTLPYVERYFSLVVGSGTRLIATYACIGLGAQITTQWETTAKSLGWAASGIETGWIIAAGSIIYAAFCWHAPKWISGHLAGAPSLSASDVHGCLVAAFTALTAGTAALSTLGSSAAAAGAAKAATAGISGGMSGGATGTGTGPTPAPPSSGGGSPSGPKPQPPSSGGGFVKTATTVLNGAANTLRSIPQSGTNGSGPRVPVGHD